MKVEKTKIKNYIDYLKEKCNTCVFKGKLCNDCASQHVIEVLIIIKTRKFLKLT